MNPCGDTSSIFFAIYRIFQNNLSLTIDRFGLFIRDRSNSVDKKHAKDEKLSENETEVLQYFFVWEKCINEDQIDDACSFEIDFRDGLR